MNMTLRCSVGLAMGLYAASLAAAEVATPSKPSGPLAQYVAAPDESFHWTLRREGQLAGGQYVELTLTSQTWRDIVWQHQLFIFKPAEVSPSKQALLLIDGGSWKSEYAQPPKDKD